MTTKRKNNQAGLTPAIIRAGFAKGLGPKEIGDAHGCTKQAVSDMAKRYGIVRDPVKNTVHDNFPWKVPAKYRKRTPYDYMWAHGYYAAGKSFSELSTEHQSRLLSFYRRLLRNDEVLEFNPETGFEWHKRTASDGDLLIRVNEFTTLTDEGRFIWVRPTELPTG